MKVKVIHIGRKERIPSFLSEKFCELETKTAAFDEFVLNIAFDYGARDEIVLAVKKIIKAKITEEEITADLVGKYLYTSDLKYRYPELIIRTGGVSRLSGLLCWDYDFSEFYFPKKFWPDFTTDDLVEACQWFNGVERRSGK